MVSTDGTHPGAWSSTAVLGVTASIVGVLLWAHAIQNILLPQTALRGVALGLLGVYLLFTLAAAPVVTRLIAGACTAVSLLLMATGSPGSAVAEGAAFSLVFMGFLPAIALIRAVFEAGPLAARVAGRLALDQTGARRSDTLLLLSHVTGAVMTLGTFAVVAPLVGDMASDAERRETALTCLRGLSLAVLWTPFTVAMGFAGSHLPGVPLWQAMACGFLLAAVGLAVSLRGGASSLGATLASVRPAVAPVVAAAVLLVAANALTGLGTLPLIVLAMPPICVAVILWSRPAALPSVAGRLWGDLGRFGNDMLLFAPAIAMGFALKAHPGFQTVLAGLGLGGLPAVAILAVLMLLGVACALAGLHVTVTATILFAIGAGLDGALSDLSLFVLVLFAWSAGAMLSMSSLAVAVAVRTFAVPVLWVVYGPNLRLALALGTLLTLVVGGIEWMARS